jgi:putative transposase
MPWSVFLKAHWKALAASDFFTVEVWSRSGLVTYYALFVMELATRRVCIAGVTTHPDTRWMLQMARQLTDTVDGILLGKRYLILDRDAKYCLAFRHVVKREGIEVIRLPPPRSPDLNAYAQRWVRSVHEECLSKVIAIGQGMLRRALREFVEHHHLERNHQGLANALITPCTVESRDCAIGRRSRLGGVLNYYERTAARCVQRSRTIRGSLSASPLRVGLHRSSLRLPRLVPAQWSSGGKHRLGRITKGGDGYLRTP